MHQTIKRMSWLAALAFGFCWSSGAQAQYVTVYSPPRVVVPAPVVSYYTPVTTYYTPVTTYYTPTVTYSYYPSTTVYSAPVTSYYAAPAVVTPGYVATTRSYFGLGVLRPFGYHSYTTVTPATVVTPGTSFYTPVIIR